MAYGLNRRIPGFRQANKFFEVPCRNRFPQAVIPLQGLFLRDGPMAAVGAELRLSVLWSLPTRHQTYLFEEVRKLCSGYLRRNRISAEEVTPLELVSEVWKKLLGSVSLETNRPLSVRPGEWSTDPSAPERDGRVIWLIAEIGGSDTDMRIYKESDMDVQKMDADAQSNSPARRTSRKRWVIRSSPAGW